ncbi:hypothetical protein V8E53_011266 [Lactarius tabidus]
MSRDLYRNPPTPAMMVKIIVEVLDILATATKEMKQSRASVIGVTKLDDGMKRLDKLTNEEARMANAVVLKVTHSVDEKVTRVGDDVRAVGEKVQDVVTQANLITDTDRELSRQEGESRECEIDFATNGRQHRRHGNQLRDRLIKRHTGEWLGGSVEVASLGMEDDRFPVVDPRETYALLVPDAGCIELSLSDLTDILRIWLWKDHSMDPHDCPDGSGIPSARKLVLDLVKELIGLRLPNFRVSVTSRPEIDIGDTLKPLTELMLGEGHTPRFIINLTTCLRTSSLFW